MESATLALPGWTPMIVEATTLEDMFPVPVTCMALRFNHRVPLTFRVIG